LRAILLWFFLERGCGLLTVAVISTVAVLVGYGLDFIFTLRLFPRLCVGRKFVNGATVRTLLNFSVYAFIISIAFRVIFMTDNVVVGSALGPVAVTFYAVGMNLAGTLRDTLGNITILYAPLAYQMHALDRADSLRQLFLSGSRIAMTYVLPGVLGLVILGPRFLGLWMGSSFVDKSGPVLVLLALEVGFYALISAPGQVLYATKRHKVNAWLSIGNAAANLTLSVILIRRLGAVGVAWGTVIPAFLVEAIILPVYTALLLQVSPLRFYKSAVLRPLLAAVPYAWWLWFCARQGVIAGYGSLALVVTSGLLVYALLVWKFCLESEERALARQWAVRFKSALSAIGPAWGDASPS
jgi:O-antigen/teichoic acid export membrane protein